MGFLGGIECLIHLAGDFFDIEQMSSLLDGFGDHFGSDNQDAWFFTGRSYFFVCLCTDSLHVINFDLREGEL